MGAAVLAEIEEVLITMPLPASIMLGRTALLIRNMLLTLMAISRSQSASVVSRKGLTMSVPA